MVSPGDGDLILLVIADRVIPWVVVAFEHGQG